MVTETILDDTWLGKVVQINFLDHCQGSKVLAKCAIFGLIESFDDGTLVLRYWTSDIEGNDEHICLFRKAIYGITELGEKEC